MKNLKSYGWVRIYRKSLESSVWENPIFWKVWCWCLLKANHKKKMFPFNKIDIELQPGQFISGQSKASIELGLTPQQYRTAIKYLKSTNRLTTKSTNRFTIFSIINWDFYQNETVLNQQTNKPLTNQQQTTNKPLTTNKNDKNGKKEKKIDIYSAQFEQFWEIYPKKQGKGKAYESWCKINPSEQLVIKILAAVPAQAKADQWRQKGGKFIPMPATWLNQKRWDDEPGHCTPLAKMTGAERARMQIGDEL